MATYDALNALPDGEAGPWGNPVTIDYDQRDVLLYAVGIGTQNLRFVFEGHQAFSVFPTFPIRWGAAGAPIDTAQIPNSPGPLNIDAERFLELVKPLPTQGRVQVVSRLVGVHPRGKGNALVECESNVIDDNGDVYVRMVNGSFRRGVDALGDIEPFEGSGITYSEKLTAPDRAPDISVTAHIPANQGHIYRLSGDYNPLHIDPEAARFGGFDEPILHGLCTFGHCGHLLLDTLCDSDPARFGSIKVRFSSPVLMGDDLTVDAWHDGDGRVQFQGRVGERVVVSNAIFTFR